MKNIIYATISQILGRGSFMLASILLAKNLSLEDYSNYSYLIITANMIGIYSSLGLGVIASRNFAKLRIHKNTALEEIATLWYINIIITIFIGITLSLGFGSFLLSNNSIPNSLFTALVLSITLGIVPAGAIQGLSAFKAGAKISIISFFIMISCSIWSSSTGLILPAILGLILSQWYKTISEGIYTIKAISIKSLHITFNQFFNGLKRILEPVCSTALVSILAGSGVWIIGTLLKKISGDYEFALFSIGIQWYAIVLFLPGIMTRVVFAQQVKLASEKNKKREKTAHLKINLIRNLLISSIFATLLILIGPWIINLYGPKFTGMHHSLIGYLIAGVSGSAVNLVGNALVAEGRTRTWLILTTIWLLILVISSWIFIKHSGSLGIGIAYAISSTFLFLLALFTYKLSKDNNYDITTTI